MENLCGLLFELSNEDRLRIMLHLERKPMNVTNTSRKLNLTKQEVSRHISRLSEAGLIKKSVEGLYSVTDYGEIVLRQLDGLRFISKHRGYFASHSLRHLPSELLHRISELKGSTQVNDISAAFYNVEKTIQESEEYIFAITDHYLASTLSLYPEALERGVKVRSIDPRDWVVPQEINEAYKNLPEDRIRIIERARANGNLEEGLLDHLDIFLYLSEKRVAIIGFPLSDGRFDYLGFTSNDEVTNKWCRDLFQYYWERASNRQKVAEQLHRWIKNKPEIIRALKNIGGEEQILHNEELISQLEEKSLTKKGKLTITGSLVYARIQDKK